MGQNVRSLALFGCEGVVKILTERMTQLINNRGVCRTARLEGGGEGGSEPPDNFKLPFFLNLALLMPE